MLPELHTMVLWPLPAAVRSIQKVPEQITCITKSSIHPRHLESNCALDESVFVVDWLGLCNSYLFAELTLGRRTLAPLPTNGGAPMHRRYERANIPIEILRTFVSVAETGSFTRAGAILGLSQPAITAQMKRLQTMVRAEIFDRERAGSVLTERGALMLSHARRILDENDQILSLGGSIRELQPLRIGLSTLYAAEFFEALASTGLHKQLTFFCAHSVELQKSFTEGYLDVVCLFGPSERPGRCAGGWSEDFVWVRSREFVLSPGSPIPIISWPEKLDDQPAVSALEKNGLAYRISFTSYDHGARLAAVASGIGLTALPERHLKAPLIVANDYYLPPLKSLLVGVYVRDGLPTDQVEEITQLLMTLSPRSTHGEGLHGHGIDTALRSAS